MDKLEIVFDLIQEGAIDLEEARILLEQEKEFIYVPTYSQPYLTYHYPNYPVHCGTLTYANASSVATCNCTA